MGWLIKEQISCLWFKTKNYKVPCKPILNMFLQICNKMSSYGVFRLRCSDVKYLMAIAKQHDDKFLPWLACEGSDTLTDSCPVKELTPIMPLWAELESWVCPRGTL